MKCPFFGTSVIISDILMVKLVGVSNLNFVALSNHFGTELAAAWLIANWSIALHHSVAC